MKKFFFSVACALMLFQGAGAVRLKEVEYDRALDSIVATLFYPGGCVEHHFKLHFHQCKWASPRGDRYLNECNAAVQDATEGQNNCEAMRNQKVMFSMASMVSNMRPMVATFQLASGGIISIQIPKAKKKR